MRGAYAVLTACKQSHPFEERKVKIGPENDPLKIGRAVARLKPQPNNAIFDCKVLSRNHAILYYENEQFYIRDTKSSNGTFVNNERLAVTSEESEPREVYSGDILQFGVEIVENANKVTHGCIFAFVRVFDENGKEVAAPSATISKGKSPADEASFSHTLIGAHQLFQLQQYIKEALYREKAREEKMRQLEALLVATDGASETAWKALVKEDRLLARIESLESQLALYSKNAHSDKVKVEMEAVLNEKAAYESTFRDALKRAVEEKLEALLRLTDVERSLMSTEEDCSRLRQRVTALEAFHATAVEEYEKQLAANHHLRTTAEESNSQLTDRAVAAEKLALSVNSNPAEVLVNQLLNGTSIVDISLLRSLASVLQQKLAAEDHPSEPVSLSEATDTVMGDAEKKVEVHEQTAAVVNEEMEQILHERDALRDRVAELEMALARSQSEGASAAGDSSFPHPAPQLAHRPELPWITTAFLISLLPGLALLLLLHPLIARIIDKKEE